MEKNTNNYQSVNITGFAKFIFTMLFLIIFCLVTKGFSLTISGNVVVDRVSSTKIPTPLTGVGIYLLKQKGAPNTFTIIDSATSDTNGCFSFKNVKKNQSLHLYFIEQVQEYIAWF
jgi:hypothetical protein